MGRNRIVECLGNLAHLARVRPSVTCAARLTIGCSKRLARLYRAVILILFAGIIMQGSRDMGMFARSKRVLATNRAYPMDLWETSTRWCAFILPLILTGLATVLTGFWAQCSRKSTKP